MPQLSKYISHSTELSYFLAHIGFRVIRANINKDGGRLVDFEDRISRYIGHATIKAYQFSNEKGRCVRMYVEQAIKRMKDFRIHPLTSVLHSTTDLCFCPTFGP